MRALQLLGSGLLLTFLACAVASGALQLLAWTRHAREGVPVSVKALWRPHGRFDEIGLRQMLLARTLMVVGIISYLSYGVLLLIAQTFAS
jgi:hypothetical protein